MHSVLGTILLLLHVNQQWADHAMIGLEHCTWLLSQTQVYGTDGCVCLSHWVPDWKHQVWPVRSYLPLLTHRLLL